MKGGGDLAISEFGFVTPKGRTLEGNGVTPDKLVVVTLTDLQRQQDIALGEAERYFNSLLERRK